MDDQAGEALLAGLERELFYNGGFHPPQGGYADTFAPATGKHLGKAACANAVDVDLCVRAAYDAFPAWRDRAPAERARCLKALAVKLREAAGDLAWLDAVNCGNPIGELMKDAMISAAVCDYYAGLVLEAKGSVLPTQDGVLNYSLRQPFGVVARIVAYNHPLLFMATKLAPAVAVGNTVILKAPDQAPLSAYRLGRLVADQLARSRHQAEPAALVAVELIAAAAAAAEA